MGTILVVEDDSRIQKALQRLFAVEGFEVKCAADGTTGLEYFLAGGTDAVVLDLMLPGISGRELCKTMKRSAPDTPVIILSAVSEVADKVLLLELGADDYVTKPFSPRELVARIKAVLRRTLEQREPVDVVKCGELAIDSKRHEVTYAGRPVALTATEFRILQFLAGRPGRVVSRDEIIDGALGRDAAIFDRTIDVHITSIRKKLGDGGAQIETVRGFGYKFRD
jgi:DNA-binding response OmpR family regulator